MLTTYDALMHEARVTRQREATYDNRDPQVLLAEYRATIDVLRWEVQRLRQAVKDSLRGMEGQ